MCNHCMAEHSYPMARLLLFLSSELRAELLILTMGDQPSFCRYTGDAHLFISHSLPNRHERKETLFNHDLFNL